jgi:uncharacterized protein YegP (UPF0339 family)
MAGKFVIKKGRTGQFRFSLVGRNGQIVATSETYTTKASCLNGIKAVKTLAADAAIEDQTKEWAAQHADMKDKAATRGATKAAAKAAKEAIAKAAPLKRTAKKPAKRGGGSS